MEREPAAPSSDETVEIDPDETTRADTEWPVAEQFRVTPEPILAEREHDGTPTTVVDRPPRRLTSAPTLAMILASLALLVLLAAGTAWLVTGDEPTQASTRPPTSQKSAVLKATTTPAPSKPESTPVTTTAADPASTPTAEVAVPGVIGLSASDAAREIRAAGLRSQVRLTTSSRTAGTVIAQSPAEGEAIERDGVVEIDVAKRIARPAAVRVPGLTGSTAADAKNRLRALGLHWSVVDVTSDEPRGMVVGQSPTSGVEVRKGQTVTLRVSSSPAQIAVPDVTGLDAQSARVELEGAGFDVTVVDQPTTDPAEDGTVIGQDPAGGQEAEKGATVTITVARLG